MNGYTLLKAIGEIDDKYILSAQEKLGLSPVGHRRGVYRFPRTLAALITALALLFSTFTVAMAVSEDFREAVFTFLGLEQTVIVPEYTTDGTAPAVEAEHPRYSDMLEGTFVHIPEASHARNGMFLICTDQQMMRQGSHFVAYIEDGGQLIQLEQHHFSGDFALLGNSFHVEFDWAEHNGVCSFTYVDPKSPIGMAGLSGPPEAVLMTFNCTIEDSSGNSLFTLYPVLMNLYTGEMTDVLAGTGAETMPGIYNSAISPDGQKMLLIVTSPDLTDEDLYYADLVNHRLYSLEELSGQKPDACAFAGNAIACWTLKGASAPDWKKPETFRDPSLGAYDIWTVDPDTLERRDLFTDFPATPDTSYRAWSMLGRSQSRLESDGSITELWPDENGSYTLTEPPEFNQVGLHFLGGFSMTSHWGNMYPGSCFALEVDEGKNVFVIDLESGERTRIEGWLWPDGVQCIPSADGRKLMIYSDQSGVPDGCIGNVGVLDFDTKQYMEFLRENRNEVSEDSIYWFDHNSIIIAASPTRPDSGSFRTGDYYVYRLLDP